METEGRGILKESEAGVTHYLVSPTLAPKKHRANVGHPAHDLAKLNH